MTAEQQGKSDKPSGGFTLLEFLLLLGVVSLLVVLALSAFSRVRETSLMSQSMANLRQITHGLNLYTSEHNGYFPESAMDVWVHGQKARFWFNALSYYIDGETDLRAAGRPAGRPKWQCCPGRPFPVPARYDGFGVSVGYGWNHQFFGYNGGQRDIHRFGWRSHLSEVELPAETIIIGTNKETDGNGNPIAANDPQNVCVYGGNPSSSRFNGAGLYLFIDGHIQRLTPQEAAMGGSNGVPERYLFKKKKGSSYPEDNTPQ